MNIMIIGGGGREHALVQSLNKSNDVDMIYALPGNGGIKSEAQCVPINAKDIPAIVEFAKSHDIGFAVVAPDDPLVLGAVDALEEAGIPCFGPNRDAAIIEGSKVFAKELMRKYDIPTANYQVFSDYKAALDYCNNQPDFPIVIKADGLALGKGVMIAHTKKEAADAVRHIMAERAFGDSGKQIVIEECLCGPEVSILAFTDGQTLLPMVSSMDHKRVFDQDKGPNTGGMGAVAPNPYYTPEIASVCMERIFIPTIRAMEAEGRRFRGCLYFGLMLTANGPKVIEYNCRFGDPEAQVVLPLLKTDLLTVMRAVREDRLHEIVLELDAGAACCVILASGGYPGNYETGKEILFKQNINDPHIFVYYAGTKKDDNDKLLTSGGRVLSVTAVAETLEQAIVRAYAAAQNVSFEGAHKRKDIGQRALAAKKQPYGGKD